MPSQAEEDLILAGLLPALGLHPRQGTFLEIGVGTGWENNTRTLAERGWDGLWVGNEAIIAPLPPTVIYYHAHVEPDTVTELPLPAHVDLLSIDIDGNDYWVMERLLPLFTELPRIIVVEYNSAWDGDDWVMQYTPGYVWHTGQPFGASLLRWRRFLESWGYRLVYTTDAKVNAFFVRTEGIDHGVIDRLVQQSQGDPA